MKDNTKKCIYVAVNVVMLIVCYYLYSKPGVLNFGYISSEGAPAARGVLAVFMAYRVIKVSEFLLFNKE